VKQVYSRLCLQSKKRDNWREHSSKSYTLAPSSDGESIWIQPQLKDLHPGSLAYIRTDEVPLAFSGGTFDPVTASTSQGITVGEVVVWKDPRVFIASEDHESVVHEEQDLSEGLFDIPGVRSAVAGGAEVSAVDNDYVWLKISLGMLDDEIRKKRGPWTGPSAACTRESRC
jgi:hypothetical protein